MRATATHQRKKSKPKRRPKRVSPSLDAFTPHRIRTRAYAIFLSRNGGQGDHLSDWLQAERELAGAVADDRMVNCDTSNAWAKTAAVRT